MAFRVQITQVRPADVLARDFKEYMRVGLYECVGWWHRNIVGEHFTEGAKGKYGYKPRSTKYEARKRENFGHTNPLVYSGRTESDVRQMIRVSGTRIVKGTMHANVLNYLGTGKTARIDARAELTKTVSQENQALAERLRDNIERQIAAVKHTKTEEV